VYAPALVAFVGAVLTFGGRSDPGVGWFPLAPHEPYRPPYHASPTYITNVNVTNTVIRQTNVVNIVNNVNNVTNIRYANRNVPGAMVAMPARQFARAAPTRRAAFLLPPGVARAAPVLAAPHARALPQSRVGTPPARRLPPAPVMRRVAVTRALPPSAFAHAGAGARAHGAPAPARLAAHAPVPPLRVLRPALGKPVTPRPAQPPYAMAERRALRTGQPDGAPAPRPLAGPVPSPGRQLVARGGSAAGATAAEPGRRPPGRAALPGRPGAPVTPHPAAPRPLEGVAGRASLGGAGRHDGGGPVPQAPVAHEAAVRARTSQPQRVVAQASQPHPHPQPRAVAHPPAPPAHPQPARHAAPPTPHPQAASHAPPHPAPPADRGHKHGEQGGH
jgi:hypothetical protein